MKTTDKPAKPPGRKTLYPFATLLPGQAVQLPLGVDPRRVTSAANMYAKRNNPLARFCVRDGEIIRLPDRQRPSDSSLE